jgi:hypothetical protein
VVVLCGLPGSGKSQIAGAVARDRVAAGWPLVGWVPAQTGESLLAGLAELAALLGVADLAGDSRRSAERLRDHLQGRTHPGLLVLDNLTDPQLVRDLLPGTGSTRALVTSTEISVAGLGALVEVGGFPRAASIGYLISRTGRDDPAEADALAGELDDLPVALAQAAAAVAGPPRISCRDLLEELAALPVGRPCGGGPGRTTPAPS